ncbi:MAG TPA: hypothetical protein VFK85_10110 [Anaeromyxobacteraceae bacterium]|nr:hypothetical protein [Anaeromyxobacteraceae bacterium]
MFRKTIASQPQMFDGVARPHWIRDLATVALCLSLIGGFVAQATRPAQAAPPARAGALVATTAVPAPCPDVTVQ